MHTPTLGPAAPSRPALPDALAPQAIAWWPFPALTQQQQAERRALEHALRAGELRGLPSVFGALA